MAFKCGPESSVRRLVECPICFDTFTNPKELDCQHTFCEKPCLDKLVDSKTNTLQCPLCRAVHNIPKGGIQELKNNKTIAYLVEITEESKTDDDAKTQCEVCVSNDYIDGCLHCSKMVCADCKTRHTEHMLLDVQQLTSSVLEATKSSLVQVEVAKSDLENDVTTLKSKMRGTIDEFVRHIQQRGRDIEHELDYHLATELSKITVVDDMCLNLNEVIGICHEIQQNMTSATPQVTIEGKRKLLVEQYKDITAKFSMPSVSKIDVRFDTRPIMDIIKHFGTIIQVENNQTQSTGNNLQSSKAEMDMICDAPRTKDIINLSKESSQWLVIENQLKGCSLSPPTIGMTSVSSNTNDVSLPRKSTRSTAPVHLVASASSDSNTVTHPRNTIQGTATAMEVGSDSSDLIEVTRPRNTNRGTTPVHHVTSVSADSNTVTRPRNTIQGTAPEMDVSPVSSDMIEVSHPRNATRSTTPALDVISAAPGTKTLPQKTIRGTANHQFRDITSVAISRVTGDIAVCDMGRHVIAVFTKNGQFKTEFGGLGTETGLFNAPRGVTFNKSEHIIVADSLNNRLQIFDDVSQQMMAFSQKGNSGYDVNDPRDVAASESNIWVCDHGNNRIRIFTKDGRNSTGNNITSLSFTNPTRVLLDNLHGSICILDSNGLHYFEPREQDETTFRNATDDIIEHRGITKDSAIAFNEHGVLIYTDKSNRIFVFDRNDMFVNSFMSPESQRTNTAVKALAIRKGRIVVAGSKFVEIY